MQKIILTLMLLTMFSSLCNAAPYWRTNGHIAYAATVINGKYVTFSIDWDPSSACKPTAGLIVTNTNALGSFKKSQQSSENMVVRVNGQEWSGLTMIAAYTGGFEAMMYANPELIYALKSNSKGVVHVKIFKNSPTFEFDLEGASNHINMARNNCR